MKSIFLKLKLVFTGSKSKYIDLPHSLSACLSIEPSKLALTLLFLSLFTSNLSVAQSNSGAFDNSQAELEYKQPQVNESEFDNRHDEFSVFWRDANESYEDTVFGELVYNEPSTATKLEILRLLSKDTPSLMVCLLYTSPSPRDQRGSRMPSSA